MSEWNERVKASSLLFYSPWGNRSLNSLADARSWDDGKERRCVQAMTFIEGDDKKRGRGLNRKKGWKISTPFCGIDVNLIISRRF